MLERIPVLQHRISGRGGFVGAGDRGVVGRVVEDHGIRGGLLGDLAHDGDERVDGLLRLGLRGLDHEGLVEEEREVDCRGVVAVVQQALGHVEGRRAGHVVVGAVVDEAVEDELMLADALDRELVAVLEAFLDVVGAENGELAHLAEMLATNRQYIRVSAQDDAEIAMKTGDLDLGDAVGQALGHADRTAAGTAAAVGRREGLVEVEVHDVKAHVTGTDHAEHRVHVGAVVVEQAADTVHELRDLEDLGLEQAEGVGVRHHDAGHGLVEQGLEGLHVDAAVLQGLHLHDLQTADRRRSGVGAVGAVGDDDLGAGHVAAAHMVRADQHETRQLAVGTGARVEGERVHAGNLGEGLVHLFIDLADTGDGGVGHQRMEGGEAGHGGHLLVDLGIVLHRAGAERIEARIHAEVHLGEVVVVADHLGLADLGKPGRSAATQLKRKFR